MIIHKEPTKPPPGRAGTGWVHYNMENSPMRGKLVWDVKKLLEVGGEKAMKKKIQPQATVPQIMKSFSNCLQQFSSDIADNASSVCLAHLFTYQDFDEGTLGLAYVAPSKPLAMGGLCPKRKDNGPVFKTACLINKG